MEDTILKKASELFLLYGFKNVTMDEIANDLGISKKTIYVYYENKSDLVEAVVNYLFDEIIKIVENIHQLKLNPIDECFKMYETISLLLKEEKVSVEYQLRKYFPEIYEKINCAKTSLFHTSITRNLQKGIADGYYRPTLDINFTSKFLLLVVTGIKNAEPDELGEVTISYAMEQFFELYFRSIATEKGLKILEQNLNK